MSEHPRDISPSRDEDTAPEWWAQGAEWCTCSHHYDSHLLMPSRYAGTCLVTDCQCSYFKALDSAPSTTQDDAREIAK